ncbi:hypothetical protein [uncultured Metabacillus sp.]|uniref:hypothetical protein n=1 Tax=uncultured Metabacillus sp. TaxID=2860135 RepID=UPI0026248B23|nr:hypothetical protein [uncultured Metabacillus sp.]
MGFKIPEDKLKPKLEPFASFNGEQVNLDELENQSLTLDFYTNTDIRANTPGQNELIKKYTNEVLVYKLNKHILPNCSSRDDITYDGALQLRYVPELIKRIQELENELSKVRVTSRDNERQVNYWQNQYFNKEY